MSAAENPFSVLTFIVVPAIITNASSILINGTGLRYGRVVDLFRSLAGKIKNEPKESSERVFAERQQRVAGRRMLLLVRALTAFYFALGAFALTTLLSIAGAVSVAGELLAAGATTLLPGALVGGIGGVGGLTVGASLLVREVWLAHAILREEAELIAARVANPYHE